MDLAPFGIKLFIIIQLSFPTMNVKVLLVTGA